MNIADVPPINDKTKQLFLHALNGPDSEPALQNGFFDFLSKGGGTSASSSASTAPAAALVGISLSGVTYYVTKDSVSWSDVIGPMMVHAGSADFNQWITRLAAAPGGRDKLKSLKDPNIDSLLPASGTSAGLASFATSLASNLEQMYRPAAPAAAPAAARAAPVVTSAPPEKEGMSGGTVAALAIGGIVVVGLLGAGIYFATRSK